MAPLFRWALAPISPGGPRSRLSVLAFYRVLERADPVFPEAMTEARFDETCRWLRELFNVLPLDEAVARLKSGTLPARAAAITFDDGYADNHDVALRVLLGHRLSATIFVATGFLDGDMMWNDSITEAVRASPLASLDVQDLLPSVGQGFALAAPMQRRFALERIIAAVKYLTPDQRLDCVRQIVERSAAQLPRQLMMNGEHLRAMHRAGMLIGAHTVTHPILANLPRGAARAEMLGGKRALESLLGAPVTLFAYPNGKPGEDFNGESVEIAREIGFGAAVTTAWGAAHRDTDPLQIPRFTPWDRTMPRFAARMASNLWKSRSGAAQPLISPHLRSQSQPTP